MRPTLIVTILLMSSALCLKQLSAAKQSNVVYIMADELGYYELGCMGSKLIKTPNIDRMASEGIKFTQALAGSAVCAPTRCCLMTGKHSGHTSVRVNGGGTPLRAEEITIASLLKEQGYATGGFGKWGCGGRGSTGVPEDHGFDVFLGYYDQVHAHSYYPPYIVRNSEEVPLKNNHGLSNGETYSHYVIMENGLNFIHENKDQPFFAYFPITPPHGIFDIPDSDPAWELYKDKDWPEPARRYASMISMVDRNVGEILSLLKELDLEENTLVFFCGDNGGNDYFKDKQHPRGFFGPNVHPETGVEFRGTKGTLYEGGLRIPMMARWPGKIPAGRTSDLLWYFPDVMPTVCDVAGIEPPDDIDGISVLPELFGKSQKKHEFLYWEIGSQTAVRWNNWKAYRKNPKSNWELYNLESDVSEANDIADDHEDVLNRMIAMAESAHTPAVEGTFHNREIHEKDRRAKFGGKAPANLRKSGAKNDLNRKGLVDFKQMKVVRFSSQNEGNGKFAKNAIDGDPNTIWHTSFSGGATPHPHEIVIDLGKPTKIGGIRYLSRQDAGWNGTIKKYEISISDSLDDFDSYVCFGEFEKVRDSQEKRFTPTTGRCIKLKALSEVNDGPWASIAEIGFVKAK